jgi:HD-like signal output (HDOD) protein
MTVRVSTPEPFEAERLRDLSALPSVALRALELLGNEAVETTALVEVVTPDPTFVADLLSCANSALFGLKSQVRTVRHAIVVLGRDRLKGVVLTTALRSYLKRGHPSAQRVAWWRHSLATALLSEAVAVADAYHCPAGYTAGLLHDIGRLALQTCLSEGSYEKFVRAAEESLLPIRAVERERFGLDHCEIGEMLLKQWRLPAEFGVAALYHHEPGRWQGNRGLGVVGVACAVSGTLGFEAIRRPQATLSEEILAALPGSLRRQLLTNPAALQSALTERIDSLHAG